MDAVLEGGPQHELELAVARPPHLREAAAMPSVVGGADFAEPSELRQQSDRDWSGGFDPEISSATAEPAEVEVEDPAPIGSSRGKIVGLLVGLGLVVMLLSWVAYSKFFGSEGDPGEKIDDGRDQSGASLQDPNAATESSGATPEADSGAAHSDAVVETGGTEIVPEVEPVEIEPKPKPKNGEPRNGKPKNGASDSGEPANSKDPAGDSGSHKPECEDVAPEARAAAESLDWVKVVKLTARSGCWSSGKERTLLRVRALPQCCRGLE